jgi:CheY-like chemotaxis protein
MKYTILFVDDCQDMQFLMPILFKAPTYRVIPAHDGTEAMAILSTIRPDIIFLDHNMVGMDGTEFMHEFLKLYNVSDIPIILISGNEPMNYQHIGATEVLRKPVGVDKFHSLVNKYVIKNYLNNKEKIWL